MGNIKTQLGARQRTVVNARRAIADFVESNVPRLNSWLERVADGIPKRDANGGKIRDSQGSVVYVVKPDPATAMKLVGDLCEYHLPKLSRSEAHVVAQVEHNTAIEHLGKEELERRLLVAMGVLDNSDNSEVIDVEHSRVETPSWMKPETP